MRQAQIYSSGVLAGTLTETDDGHYRFRYDDAFWADERQTAISPSFPKSGKIDEEDAFGLLLATAHTDTIGAITVKRI